MKRSYSGFTVKEAMRLIPAEEFTRWHLNAPPRQPSDYFRENLRPLESFDLENSESAKTMLIDDLLGEIVPDHPKLKVWKAASLETDALTGTADYLIRRSGLMLRLLCLAWQRQKRRFCAGASAVHC